MQLLRDACEQLRWEPAELRAALEEPQEEPGPSGGGGPPDRETRRAGVQAEGGAIADDRRPVLVGGTAAKRPRRAKPTEAGTPRRELARRFALRRQRVVLHALAEVDARLAGLGDSC